MFARHFFLLLPMLFFIYCSDITTRLCANIWLCLPLGDRNHKRKLQFQPGDKVCCTKNGYLTDVEDMKNLKQLDATDSTQSTQKEKEKISERLCNGEIFFIAAVSNMEYSFALSSAHLNHNVK